MSDVTIWHNAKCSKSRAALALLRERGHEPHVVRYLEDAPSTTELKRVLNMMGGTPRSLMRTGEPRFRELGLENEQNDEVLIRAMAEHPILIQRPVVLCGTQAVIGRPPENVLALFD